MKWTFFHQALTYLFFNVKHLLGSQDIISVSRYILIYLTWQTKAKSPTATSKNSLFNLFEQSEISQNAPNFP